MAEWWQVRFAFRRELDAAKVERLLEALAAQSPTVSAGEGHQVSNIVMSVLAPSLASAFEEGRRLLSAHVRPVPSLVEVEILPQREADAEGENVPPRLLGAFETAAFLGVSKQRLWEIRRQRDDFPAPIAELKNGPVWSAVMVEAFLARWERPRGRPKAKAAAP